MKVIDMHAHAFPKKIAEKAVTNLGHFYNFNLKLDGSFDGLCKSANDANMFKVLFFATATTKMQVESVNNFVAEKQNSKMIGFGTIHPDYENKTLELERLISLGLHGIKLHPDFQEFKIDSEKMHEVYEFCEKNNLPIMMHAGDKRFDFSGPQRIRNVIDTYPNLRVIAAHLGGYSQWDDAEKYLFGRNIYFDTSSAIDFMSKETAKSIILSHGTDKIFFGTDYPIITHKNELENFINLGLSQEDNEKILYKNAVKFLNIKD